MSDGFIFPPSVVRVHCKICKQVYPTFSDNPLHVCSTCKADAFDELVKALDQYADPENWYGDDDSRDPDYRDKTQQLDIEHGPDKHNGVRYESTAIGGAIARAALAKARGEV